MEYYLNVTSYGVLSDVRFDPVLFRVNPSSVEVDIFTASFNTENVVIFPQFTCLVHCQGFLEFKYLELSE